MYRLYSQAFWGTKIQSVRIPKSITEILGYAFAYSSLEEVIFESGSQLVTIGDSVFEETNLKSINIPTNATIGRDAFKNTSCSLDVSIFVAGKEICSCKRCIAEQIFPAAKPTTTNSKLTKPHSSSSNTILTKTNKTKEEKESNLGSQIIVLIISVTLFLFLLKFGLKTFGVIEVLKNHEGNLELV